MVAILYTTCNDFVPDSCATMLHQHGAKTRLFILDDSTSDKVRERIDAWATSIGEDLCVVRRQGRHGFKAGNINNWLEEYGDPVEYPYVLLVDADQRIPRDFVQQLLDRFEQEEEAWFVQASHDGTASTATAFQAAMYPQVECEWRYQIPARALAGIAPMLGHGVLIDTQRLKTIGGMPLFMSEDLAVTIAFAKLGGRGVLATDVVSREEFPRDYSSYWHRRRRWIQADTELLWAAIVTLVRAPVRLRARTDLLTRQFRLPTTSTYWLLLVIFSGLALQRHTVPASCPSSIWALFLIQLAPIFPAMSLRRIPIGTKIRFLLLATFVGASTISIYPLAVYRGIRGQREFTPTGSWSRERRLGGGGFGYSLLDITSGLLFLLSGFQSGILSLMAVGLAMLMAPLLRRNVHDYWLFVGVAAFWVLLTAQIVVDLASSSVALDHLLPICGIAMVLL